MEFQGIEHYPVLYREVIENLPPECEFVFDGTLGHGGHAKLVLQDPKVIKYFGIDQDINIIQHFTNNVLDDRLKLYHGNFSEAPELSIPELDESKLDAVILDLGTSMSQLKNPKRGFSFLKDGPIDMRMNNSSSFTVKEWLQEASIEEISQVILDYGEDKFHYRIARAIHERIDDINTTLELASVIENCLPKSHLRKQKIHGATRTFQAFRIHINNELEVLKNSLDYFLGTLKPGGRLLVISFHSLEDRIVKKKFRTWLEESNMPKHLLPEGEYKEALGKMISRKGFEPSKLEVEENPASRSARLRVFEKRK
ncbi:MAG: 16S rRNA (cytosine(1402)-N(4))-methyltransferase RsmH [Candidatus Cloacimonetes bacterium]|nr:16S rRNA (cytosine(1402)-N(4))-methyltransferase RsmH [Candidatus Cloacimonadota bacterium]